MHPHLLTASVWERSEDKLLDAIVTVDGVRIVVNLKPGKPPLDQHRDLSFIESTRTDTGEVCTKYAKHKGLYFILQGGKRWIIKGSLHRFANNGQHNADDLFYRMLLFALERLERDFGLCLETSSLENLETGLNLHRMPVPRILDSLIWQGNWPVENMKITAGDFRGTEHVGYYSANYDKGKHFQEFPEFDGTCRIEKKNRIARNFRGTGIRTLADLRNPFCLIRLADMVLDMWKNDTLFFDNALLQRLDEFNPKDREKIPLWLNPKYWKDLKQKQSDGIVPKNRFKQEWVKAEKFQAQHSDLKQQISEAMAAKLEPLRQFTTENHEKAGNFMPPSISEQRQQNNPNQGIYIGVHSQPQKEETRNLHSLSKYCKFPHSQSSVWDSFTGHDILDALGEDHNAPY